MSENVRLSNRYCCRAQCFSAFGITPHGSRFSVWSVLRVQAAISIGQIGLESPALGQVANDRVGSRTAENDRHPERLFLSA